MPNEHNHSAAFSRDIISRRGFTAGVRSRARTHNVKTGFSSRSLLSWVCVCVCFFCFFFIVTDFFFFFFYHDNNLWLAARLRPVGNREAVQSPAGPQCCWLPSSCRQGYRTWPKWRGWTATQHHAQPTKHVSVYNLTAAHIWFSRGEICVL